MRYSRAKSEIATGDVLLFRGHPLRSVYTAAIRLRTLSQYTHAGLAFWIRHNGSRTLCCLESREGSGLRLVPMDGYLRECKSQWCKVDWFRLLPDVDRQKVLDYGITRWTAMHRYPSIRKMIASFGFLVPWLRGRLGLPADIDPAAICCSEFVAHALKAGGYDPRDAWEDDPHRTPPGVIASYTCLQRMGELVLDMKDCTDDEQFHDTQGAGAIVQ